MASIALTLNANAAATLVGFARSSTESVAIAGPIANSVWRSMLSRPSATCLANPARPAGTTQFFM